MLRNYDRKPIHCSIALFISSSHVSVSPKETKELLVVTVISTKLNCLIFINLGCATPSGAHKKDNIAILFNSGRLSGDNVNNHAYLGPSQDGTLDYTP